MSEPIQSDYAIAMYESGSGDRIAMLHGFTQTATSWSPVVRDLQRHYTCIAVDMPGHGNSPYPQRSVEQCAHDIAHSVGKATYIGYSFGARVALHIAVMYPQFVERLVLISGTPGIEDETERAERRRDDEMLGEYIHESGMNKFINEWLKQPMFAGLPTEYARVDERKQNLPEDMADSLRYAGVGTQEPLWNRLAELEMPVLLVAGRNDKKFVDIATRMHDKIPHSTLEIFDNVGHTVHLEDVFEFDDRLRDWLES